MGRKKDKKPIPAMGPGSKVVGLTPQHQRHMTLKMIGKKLDKKTFHISMNTILAKKIPQEFYKNEELQQVPILYSGCVVAAVALHNSPLKHALVFSVGDI